MAVSPLLRWKKCKLTVVKMEGWKRDMFFEETGLQWVPSSPHIPHPHSAYFYPISGILGELGYMSIGVGYTIPFQMFAAEWIDADKLASSMNALSIPGVVFRPIHIKPFYATGVGKNLQGVQVHLMDLKKAPLSEIQFRLMDVLNELYPDKAVFKNADEKRYRMFDQVSGSDFIRKKFSERHKFEDIKEYWYKDVESFHKLSSKYYLYK